MAVMKVLRAMQREQSQTTVEGRSPQLIKYVNQILIKYYLIFKLFLLIFEYLFLTLG